MKDLKETIFEKLYHQQIDEKLVFNKHTKGKQYNYHPKTKDELKKLIKTLIKERGNNADLNDIDTSEMTEMNEIFIYSKFNGDISKWDVSNVENMLFMFYKSKFNRDISEWDVSKVKNMTGMFYNSDFNGDISKWTVSKVTDMRGMFNGSPLEKNPPKWYKE